MKKLTLPPDPSAKRRLPSLAPGQILALGVMFFAAGIVVGVIGLRGSGTLATHTVIPDAVVAITANGFEPATIEISAGTPVTWINTDNSKTRIVASDPFPSNNDLPGLKSSQLGGQAQYRYTFLHSGTYHYHDDLNPTIAGTVIVR